MNQIRVFSKKEWLENLRTHRMLVVIGSFLILGIMSPLLAKLTPKLMEMLLPEIGDTFSEMLSQNLLQNLPEPTYVDSWLQFFKNTSQVGMILVLIVYASLLADEHQKKTLPMLMTKGLRPSSIVLGKFLVNGAILGLAYFAGFLTCQLYTWIYFAAGLTWPILAGVFYLFLAYLLILALFLFLGSFFSKLSTVLLGTIGAVGTLYLINMHPAVPPYNPISLLGIGSAFVLGSAQPRDYLGAVVIITLTIAVLIFASLRFLEKKEI